MLSQTISNHCYALLKNGMRILDMPVGIVSRIYGNSYEIIALNCYGGILNVGSVLALSETYCRDVVQGKKTIALTEMNGTPGLKGHPLYVKLPLEAYISAPIFHKGEVWGTINFTSSQLHTPFTESDVALVGDYAHELSEHLAELDLAC